MKTTEIIQTMQDYGEGIVKAKHKENSKKLIEIEFSEGNYSILKDKFRTSLQIGCFVIPLRFVIEIESY